MRQSESGIPEIGSAPPARPVTFAILACGSRGELFARWVEEHPSQGKVVAVADPVRERRDRVGDRHGVPADLRFSDWESLLARDRLADAVINTTMDRLHAASALRALELGYDMLLEKPMAATLDDCVAIDSARRRHGRIVTVCHSLRYHPCYVKVKELIDAGAVGRVISLDQLEGVDPRHQSHSFVRGNWGNEARSSFMLLAKSCHDVDILFHLAGSDCQRVSSFGSLGHFTLANKPAGAPHRCIDGCPVSDRCPYDAVKIYGEGKGYSRFLGLQHQSAKQRIEFLRTSNYGRCVFDVDNDVVDHQVATFEFEGGTTATFTMTAFAPAGRKLRVHGTYGFIRADIEQNAIELHRFWGRASTREAGGDARNAYETADSVYNKPQRIKVPPVEGGHGGGDAKVMECLVRAIRVGDPQAVLTGTAESLKTHAVTFAAELARRERRVVEINELKTVPGENESCPS
jgi:predicted dehydrogenase